MATASPNVGWFYREDTRRISSFGIDHTMRIFFEHFTEAANSATAVKALNFDVAAEAETASRVVCDEEAIETA